MTYDVEEKPPLIDDSEADEVENERTIHLTFKMLAWLLFMASEAEKHLDAALNGKPADLLRELAVCLRKMEHHFISMGYIDQNDRLLGNADQYDLMGQAFDNYRYGSWKVELHDGQIRLIQRFPVDKSK